MSDGGPDGVDRRGCGVTGKLGTADDWIVVRFSYDDLRERPRQCQQYIQQLLGKLYGLGHTDAFLLQLPSSTRELLRWAQRRGSEAAFSPKDARKLLGISAPTARKNLNRLLDLKLIEQASGGQRIRSYRLTSAGVKLRL